MWSAFLGCQYYRKYYEFRSDFNFVPVFIGYYIVRTDEGQPRLKYFSINVELTSTFLL